MNELYSWCKQTMAYDGGSYLGPLVLGEREEWLTLNE